ncbi:type III secretion system cytoplasmic ring protein SctQ [Bordetella genomosp. 4]|nr:type III secretion system cytoplasmic ring protein SctQ [Bordetella genomosp. 4]
MADEAAIPVVPLWQELPIFDPAAVAALQDGVALSPLVFNLFDESITFNLREVQQTPPADACCAALEMEGAYGRLFADAKWLDGACLRAGMSRPQQTPWSEIAPSLRVFLLSWAMANVLSRLEAVCGHDFVLSPKDGHQNAAPGLRRVALFPEGAEEAQGALIWLDLPDATMSRLPREQAHEEIWQRVPILAALQAGRQMLSLVQLASLRPGDVVLLNRPLDGLHLAVAPSLLADVREQDGGYVMCSAWYIDERREVAVEEINTETQTVPSVMLDQLTVPVVCEVGRLTMSMADLKTLKPGAVLPMSRRIDQAVDLMVNGQKIGQGELVRFDGTLGVRVTRLADANG